MVAGTIQKERAEARVDARPLRAIGRSQSCDGSARSRPPLWGRAGLGGRAAVSEEGRNTASEVRCDPLLHPPPTRGEEIAFARLPYDALGDARPAPFEWRERGFSHRDRPRVRLASGSAIRGPAQPDAQWSKNLTLSARNGMSPTGGERTFRNYLLRDRKDGKLLTIRQRIVSNVHNDNASGGCREAKRGKVT